MLNSRQRLGKSGEEAVAGYLAKKGYKIVVKNYRCKLGEIDIIARDGPVLVFIEVKTRTGSRYGSPEAAVNIRKQRQISRTAEWYLMENKLFDCPARFDVIGVRCAAGSPQMIDHIRDAFELCE
jgi:putative endonuclease